MTEQPKRGPGRPRQGTHRVPIHLTLDVKLVEALDAVSFSRSGYIEALLRHDPQINRYLQQREEGANQLAKKRTS